MTASVKVRGEDVPIDDNGQFLPRRTNKWALLCGYWLGKGFTYAEAAKRVGDTHPKTIQGIARRAGLCPPKSTDPRRHHSLSLTEYDHRMVTERAVAAGIEPGEWMERVLSCAARDDLYGAVTDGRYDTP